MSRTMNADGDLALVEASSVGTTNPSLPECPAQPRRAVSSARATRCIGVR